MIGPGQITGHDDPKVPTTLFDVKGLTVNGVLRSDGRGGQSELHNKILDTIEGNIGLAPMRQRVQIHLNGLGITDMTERMITFSVICIQ